MYLNDISPSVMKAHTVRAIEPEQFDPQSKEQQDMTVVGIVGGVSAFGGPVRNGLVATVRVDGPNGPTAVTDFELIC